MLLLFVTYYKEEPEYYAKEKDSIIEMSVGKYINWCINLGRIDDGMTILRKLAFEYTGTHNEKLK